jgi:hypothetical protein
MGLDFIRRATGKPWRKSWRQELGNLKENDLFHPEIKEASCSFTAAIDPGTSLSLKKSYVAEVGQGCVVVSDGLRRICRVDEPPGDLLLALESRGGIAEARVERVSVFGTTIEVSLV